LAAVTEPVDSAPPLAFGADAPLAEVMRTTRAMRRLAPDPVPRELLQQLVQAATWAPSGSNVQAYTYVIVTDRERLRALAAPWEASVRFYERTAVPPEGMTRDAWDREARATRYQADHFTEIPALIVACYDMGPWQSAVTRNYGGVARGLFGLGLRRSFFMALNGGRSVSRTEAASIYPGLQNMLLTARALGLGAVLTTWHLCFEQEFKEILGIPKRVKTFAAIPVGYPRGNFGPVRRRDAADVIRWDHW
jgi:nitroreductase